MNFFTDFALHFSHVLATLQSQLTRDTFSLSLFYKKSRPPLFPFPVAYPLQPATWTPLYAFPSFVFTGVPLYTESEIQTIFSFFNVDIWLILKNWGLIKILSKNQKLTITIIIVIMTIVIIIILVIISSSIVYIFFRDLDLVVYFRWWIVSKANSVLGRLYLKELGRSAYFTRSQTVKSMRSRSYPPDTIIVNFTTRDNFFI